MRFRFEEKNPAWVEKSIEQILSEEYRFIIGLKTADKKYDKSVGRKTMQIYRYENKKGELHPQIIQFYNDILDVNGNLVDIEAKTTIYYDTPKKEILNGKEVTTTSESKVERLRLNSKTIEDHLKDRRNRVQEYLISEAKKANNPLVIPIFDIVFAYMNTEIQTWVSTGKPDLLYHVIDNAPTTDDARVIAVFVGTPYEGVIKSIAALYQLEMEKTIEEDGAVRKMKLDEYLKHYIK